MEMDKERIAEDVEQNRAAFNRLLNILLQQRFPEECPTCKGAGIVEISQGPEPVDCTDCEGWDWRGSQKRRRRSL